MKKQYDTHEIEQLLGKFMAGESNLDEERALAEYFRTHDVNGEWREYKEMFTLFDNGQVDIEQGADATNGRLDARSDKLPKRPMAVREKPKIATLRWLLMGAAASIVLLLGFSLFNNDGEPQAVAPVVAQASTSQAQSGREAIERDSAERTKETATEPKELAEAPAEIRKAPVGQSAKRPDLLAAET